MRQVLLRESCDDNERTQGPRGCIRLRLFLYFTQNEKP